MLLNEADEVAEIFAAGPTPDCQEGLRGIAERVREGDTDAERANIKRHDRVNRHGYSLDLLHALDVAHAGHLAQVLRELGEVTYIDGFDDEIDDKRAVRGGS